MIDVISIDVLAGHLTLTTGERVSVTNIVGSVVVAGPTADGTWIAAAMDHDEAAEFEKVFQDSPELYPVVHSSILAQIELTGVDE